MPKGGLQFSFLLQTIFCIFGAIVRQPAYNWRKSCLPGSASRKTPFALMEWIMATAFKLRKWLSWRGTAMRTAVPLQPKPEGKK